MAFTFGMGGDVGEVFGEFMDDAAVGSVKIQSKGFASVADYFKPFFGTFSNAFGTLAFVVGDVDINAREFGVFRDERLRNDVLETAKILGVFAN